jgi:recombination protein RecT
METKNNSNQQVAKRSIDVLKSMLNADSVQEQFKNALKENSNSFVASIIDLFNSDSALQACEPKAVINEALKAATLKLPINKALGFAYIVCFNNSVKTEEGKWIKVATPTFMPGYRGYIQLAMRTGQYENINADVVYEGEITGKDKLTGFIKFDGKKTSDKIIGYFAHFELLNGFKKTLYVDLEDMAKHAKRFSPTLKNKKEVTIQTLIALAGKDPTGLGWTGDFDSMALKTCVRNLFSKYGYLSIEMQNTIANDIVTDTQEERDKLIEYTDAQVIDLNDSQDEKKDPEVKPGEPAKTEGGQQDLPY